MDRALIGSLTAKGGFKNEHDIIKKFNNWRSDDEAQKWLGIMGYDLNLLETVTAIHIPIRIKKNELANYNLADSIDFNNLTKYKKADAQIRLIIKIGDILKTENISIKKANPNANYNQVDKRSVEAYKEMWGFNDEISLWLKLFTGEEKLSNHKDLISPSLCKMPQKRLFISEFPKDIQSKLISFFTNNKMLIISDILQGRGGLSAQWLMVTKTDIDKTSWIITDINTAMNFYGFGDVVISPRGSLYIGRVTMQRKGGTPDPTSLQFKIHPCDLFKITAQSK